MLSLDRCLKVLDGWDYGLDWISVPESQGTIATIALHDELQQWANAIGNPVTVRWGEKRHTIKPKKMQQYLNLATTPKIYSRAIAADRKILKVLSQLADLDLPAGISTYSHRQIAVNARVLEIFPDSPENLLDLDVSALWHPADLEAFNRDVRQGTLTGTFDRTIRTRLSNDRSKWVKLTNRYQLFDDAGIRLGYNLEIQDLL